MKVHEAMQKYGADADLELVVSELIKLKSEQLKRPIYKCSGDIYKHIADMAILSKERFLVALLDNKHRLINIETISEGTLNQSLVHPREVFAPAIQARSAAIVLIHNHPSGDPDPSSQDFDVTKRLVKTGKMVGINVLDHIIIGCDSYYSFIDEGVFPSPNQ